LKKRNKKVLHVGRDHDAHHVDSVPPVTDKSFLVLFFKKELLPWRLARPTCGTLNDFWYKSRQN
jgi:hypothetical protein